MFIRIWAFITKQQLVWLQDFDGDMRLSIAYKSPFGGMVAYRHWPSKNIGRPVFLLDDGTCVHPYVNKWVKA